MQSSGPCISGLFCCSSFYGQLLFPAGEYRTSAFLVVAFFIMMFVVFSVLFQLGLLVDHGRKRGSPTSSPMEVGPTSQCSSPPCPFDGFSPPLFRPKQTAEGKTLAHFFWPFCFITCKSRNSPLTASDWPQAREVPLDSRSNVAFLLNTAALSRCLLEELPDVALMFLPSERLCIPIFPLPSFD